MPTLFRNSDLHIFEWIVRNMLMLDGPIEDRFGCTDIRPANRMRRPSITDKATDPLLRFLVRNRRRTAVLKMLTHRSKHVAPALNAARRGLPLSYPSLKKLRRRLAGIRAYVFWKSGAVRIGAVIAL